MLGVKKVATKVAPKNLTVEYHAFDVNGGVEKAGTLSAQSSENCDGCVGGLKTGLGVRAWVSRQRESFPLQTSTTGEVKNFFFFRSKKGTENLQLPGYTTQKGYCYTYAVAQAGFTSRVSIRVHF